MNVTFSPHGWEDYQYWRMQDRKTFDRINQLIDEATRTPFEGSGKPEPLKHHLQGYWSRRITEEHRLVYTVKDAALIIIADRYHYQRN